MDQGDDEVVAVAWRTASGYEARLHNERGLVTFEDSVAKLTAIQLGAEHTRSVEAPSVVWRLVWRGEETLEAMVERYAQEQYDVTFWRSAVQDMLATVYPTRAGAEDDAEPRHLIIGGIPAEILAALEPEPYVMIPLQGAPPCHAPVDERGPITSPGWRLIHDHTTGGAITEILQERARQRTKWSAGHDDTHHLSELASLAAHYITRGAMATKRDVVSWWRPFVQGAALCVAALESIHRKAFGLRAQEAAADDVRALEAAGYVSAGLNVWERPDGEATIRIIAQITITDGVAWRLSRRVDGEARVSHAAYKRAAGAMYEAKWRSEQGVWWAGMVDAAEEEDV